MVPGYALHDIANCAFADSELATELWDRCAASRIQLADMVNLSFREFGTSIALAWMGCIAKPIFLGVIKILRPGEIFQIVRRVVTLVSASVIHFTEAIGSTFATMYRQERLAKESQSHQNVNLFREHLLVFPQVNYHIAAALANLQLADYRRLTATGWINALNRTYSTKRRDFVNAFKVWGWFPLFHLISFLICSIIAHCVIFGDWKAASERHTDGNFAKSLEINRVRFGISDQLARILSNTADELGWSE